MNHALLAVASTSLLAVMLPAAKPRFEKVSEHYYFFEGKNDTRDVNVGAVVSEDGVLIVDPPGEKDLAPVIEALKRITSRPVRWIINTSYSREEAGGSLYFARQGAIVLGSAELWRLATASRSRDVPAEDAERKGPKVERLRAESEFPRFAFKSQIRLFPGGIEARILAVQRRAHTAGDVVVFLPAEKVLQTGDFFVSASYPEIDDSGGEGSALGWIDGLKQIIESIPVLKSAIPPAKPDPTKAPLEEKTPEESITVIPARGPQSNLKEMKNMLEAALKLRAAAASAVSGGHTRDSFLASNALDAFRAFTNLDSYAGLLFDELLKPK